jgi:hypothetical protein
MVMTAKMATVVANAVRKLITLSKFQPERSAGIMTTAAVIARKESGVRSLSTFITP